MSSGGAKCWGDNSSGQIGDGTTAGVTSLSSGYYSTCAVVAGGALKCWGRNRYYEFAHPVSNGGVSLPAFVLEP